MKTSLLRISTSQAWSTEIPILFCQVGTTLATEAFCLVKGLMGR